MKTALRGLLTLASILALPALAADWAPIRKSDEVSLAIDRQSIRRAGDESSFRYLVEFATTQGNPHDRVLYRSLVVNASVRCKAKTIAVGKTEAYPEPGAKGKLLATKSPPRGLALFQPVEARTSDEDLWKHLCEGAKANAKKK